MDGPGRGIMLLLAEYDYDIGVQFINLVLPSRSWFGEEFL